jgi:Cytochrome oxidase complex assembly protein 1
MSQATTPSWWGRNWKWVVPVGCLTPLVLCGGFIALIFALVFGAIKSSDVYKEAVARAKEAPAVQSALGTPITEGMFVSGNLNTGGASGSADLAIPISGPKGSGTVYAVATMVGGKWTFTTLEVAVPGSADRINLLAEK